MRYGYGQKQHGIGKAVKGTVLAAAAFAAVPFMAVPAFAGATGQMGVSVNTLGFDQTAYKTFTVTENGQTIPVRAYENIVYVTKPVDTDYQSMNIYIPEAYFAGGAVNGYTAETAPVYFRNTVSAYMPGKALSLTSEDTGNAGGGMPAMASADGTPLPMMGAAGSSDTDNMKKVLAQGYVLACPGARGRTNTSADGTVYTGKAPAGLVDLKAAVRYLRHNDAAMPGNADKIISDGTSAGGAMSALLGATGNNAAYAPFLTALGAADERDDIYISLDYCPIINVDHADAAYEWQYAGLTSVNGMFSGRKAMTYEQLQLSEELRSSFPAYLNSLNLKAEDGTPLTLSADGTSGSFKEYIKSLIIQSAQTALNSGTDLSSAKYLTIRNGQVTDVDFAGYNAATERQKAPVAFDALDLSAGENGLFGTAGKNAQHFTEFGLLHNTKEGATMADSYYIRLMNPMSFLGQSGNTLAPYFRIRYGTADSNTSQAIEAAFAAKLRACGANVDIAFPWGVGHSGDYDFDTLFPWIDAICKG